MNFFGAVIIIVLCLFFISAAIFLFFQLILLILFWGAIYVPTGPETVKKIIDLAKIKPGELAVDLGSGDGRIVIALAEAGVQAHGYEINPFLVWLSRRNIRRAGLSDKAIIHWKNFWPDDFSRFDIIVVFGIAHIMKRLEVKLKKELKDKARIICVGFPLPAWPELQKDSGIYLYEQRV